MVVRSVGCFPNTFVAESTYMWINPSGRRVSPPSNVDSSGREMSLDGIHRSDLRLLGDDDERKVFHSWTIQTITLYRTNT